jgi:hypothetical protein
VLDLSGLAVEEIDNAVADQTDYDHRWMINPQTGEIVFWTADTGIGGQTPVDLDELDLVRIDPLPSWVWYQDIATSPKPSPMNAPGAGWHGPSREKAPSAGSGTSSASGTRNSCQHRPAVDDAT